MKLYLVIENLSVYLEQYHKINEELVISCLSYYKDVH